MYVALAIFGTYAFVFLLAGIHVHFKLKKERKNSKNKET